MVVVSESLARNLRVPRVLIIEDEQFIALLIEDMVQSLGCRVSAIALSVAAARQELAKRNFDVVLLDIKLDKPCTEIADVLLELSVPFGFITGYDHVIEPRHDKVSVLHKPFTTEQLGTFLEKLIGPPMLGHEAKRTVA